MKWIFIYVAVFILAFAVGFHYDPKTTGLIFAGLLLLTGSLIAGFGIMEAMNPEKPSVHETTPRVKL
jgi:hypothetical protein